MMDAGCANIHEIRSFLSDDDAPEIILYKARHGTTDLHGHSFYELVYIQEGSCLHEKDGQTMLVMGGDLLLVKPGCTHRYLANHDIRLYNCLFTRAALGEETFAQLEALDGMSLLFSDCADHGRAHLSIGERELVEKRMEALFAMGRDRPLGWCIALKSELTLLLVDCARICSRRLAQQGETRPYVSYVAQALRAVDAGYMNDLSVAELAQQAGISPDYFTRQFRRVTGITPADYLRRYRIARAMELLKLGRSVSDTAGQVGFRSLSHFSREFKAQLGVTPQTYRKDHLKED